MLVQLAKREWWSARTMRQAAAVVAIAIVLSATGAFESQAVLEPLPRFGFWLSLVATGFAAQAVTKIVLKPVLSNAQPWLRLVTVAALSAVPMTFVVAWAMGLVRPGRVFGLAETLALFPYVTLVQMIIAGIIAVLPQPPPVGTAPAEQSDNPQFPRELLSRLPPALRSDIVALQAEDHYLRVHTLHGSGMILMRITDAASLIDPALGMQVHRSWWVAKDVLGNLDSGGGRAMIRLPDGTAVPVSRNRLAEVRAAAAR